MKALCEDLKGKGLEVIFVSGDRDENSFKEYFGEMPWLAIDFNDKASRPPTLERKDLDAGFGGTRNTVRNIKEISTGGEL